MTHPKKAKADKYTKLEKLGHEGTPAEFQKALIENADDDKAQKALYKGMMECRDSMAQSPDGIGNEPGDVKYRMYWRQEEKKLQAQFTQVLIHGGAGELEAALRTAGIEGTHKALETCCEGIIDAFKSVSGRQRPKKPATTSPKPAQRRL